MMKSSELSLYENMAQHELLKHGQVMSGLVVHKAAQIAGADVEEALSPLNSVTLILTYASGLIPAARNWAIKA
jgi:hypothetical protein